MKTYVKVSDDLEGIINNILKEVVLQGTSLDSRKKWLKRYFDLEGVNYDKFEDNMLTLLDAFHENDPDKAGIRRLASLCFVRPETVDTLFDALDERRLDALSKQMEEEKSAIEKARKEVGKKDMGPAEKADVLFQTAKDFCIKREFEKAVPFLLESARLGDSRAQGHLANFYANGKGVERDEEESFKWALAAARQGNPYGQNLVGFYFLFGCKTVLPDDNQAFYWFKQSADQDYPYGLLSLGQCYHCGIGVAKDKNLAYEYFRKAAERGNVSAQSILAGETWPLLTEEFIAKARKESAQ